MANGKSEDKVLSSSTYELNPQRQAPQRAQPTPKLTPNQEVLLAGSTHNDNLSDLKWCRQQPMGNWAIRTTGFVMRKAFRKGCTSITFDYDSFKQAMDSLEPNTLVVLAPNHRSFMDFIVCSYLCFSHPELKISIPYIAADLQLGGLPFLGWFLKQTYAFYLKRGQGKADPELNQKIRQLVEDQQTLEIFIEGTRSRGRQCLQPKRGLLRALQQTGENCALLPISINYDRMPEEEALMRELAGTPKPLMRMKPLLKWSRQVLRGEIQIGRVHIVCGEPVLLQHDSDVYAVSHNVIAELQKNHVASDYHLKAFLKHHPDCGYTLESLSQAIRARGGQLYDSPLTDVSQVDALTECSYRNQWLHLFFPELRALSGQHPIVQHCLNSHSFAAEYKRKASETLTAQQIQLIQALFQPLAHTHATLMAQLEQNQGLPFHCLRPFVAAHPSCFLPWAEAIVAHLLDVELLVKTEKAFELGPRWEQDAEHYLTPLFTQSKSV